MEGDHRYNMISCYPLLEKTAFHLSKVNCCFKFLILKKTLEVQPELEVQPARTVY